MGLYWTLSFYIPKQGPLSKPSSTPNSNHLEKELAGIATMIWLLSRHPGSNHGAREDSRINGQMELDFLILTIYFYDPKFSGYVTLFMYLFLNIKIQ